jgi:hypothetical protein
LPPFPSVRGRQLIHIGAVWVVVSCNDFYAAEPTYSGRSIESAVVKNFFAAKLRKGQRCIHFITCAVITMSELDFGA